MTLVEAGKILGISAETLRSQIRSGRIRGVRKVGPVWTMTPGQVERYRREHLGQMGPKPRAKS